MGTIKQEEYKSDAGVYAIGVTKKELRVLSFWANVGLSKSKGGYQFELAKKMVKYFLKGKDTLAFIRTSFTKLIKDLIAREKGSKYEPKVYMEDAGFNRAKDQTIAMLKSLIE